MTLKSIKEHEDEVRRIYNTYYSGIACPNCGTELQFEGRGVMLSSPPQKNVKCFNCGYSDRIFVL